jgi:hypothetical protein
MEEQDYIELQTLLAKLEVAIGEEYKQENMNEWWDKRLTRLQEGIYTVRKNVFFK